MEARVNLGCLLNAENLPFYQISRQYHKSVMHHDSYPNFLYRKGFWKPHTFQKCDKKDFEIFIILSMVVIFTLSILSRATE